MTFRYFLIPICQGILAIVLFFHHSCGPGTSEAGNPDDEYERGTFGYDLTFLMKFDKPVVLKSKNGSGQVIVSPKYQGKVLTSTAQGNSGISFGWINYDAIASEELSQQINLYGGEDRLWLGPEGGQFSIFFGPGTPMNFENWITPAPIDYEEWDLKSASENVVEVEKEMNLANYSGTDFHLRLNRKITLLEQEQIESVLKVSVGGDLDFVGYETENIITNLGHHDWTKESGTL